MNIIVIGGTGHIGTFLVPRLIAKGHSVTVVSRQRRAPYQADELWQKVNFVTMDRTALEEKGEFANAIAALGGEVVVDLIGFHLDSTRHLTEALKGKVKHFLHCGTIWIHGYNKLVPVKESDVKKPIEEYGIQKLAIENYLLKEADQSQLTSTIIHPGHIAGPGWNPINPVGNFNNNVFERLATGQEVLMPNAGLETLHHVHADDVALGFMLAMNQPEKSAGESFNILSERACTWRGYAEDIAAWYGKSAKLKFVSFDEFKVNMSPEEAKTSWAHLLHSSNGSIEKARQLLNYNPRYTSLEAIQESLTWIKENGARGHS